MGGRGLGKVLGFWGGVLLEYGLDVVLGGCPVGEQKSKQSVLKEEQLVKQHGEITESAFNPFAGGLFTGLSPSNLTPKKPHVKLAQHLVYR